MPLLPSLARSIRRIRRADGLVALVGTLAAGLSVVAGVLLSTAETHHVAAAPAQQSEPEAWIYMPVNLRDARREQLLAPPPNTPTPLPTATEVVPPTPTVEPTFTPLPSATPTTAAGGSISGRLTLDGDPAPPGLGSFGPGLLLRRCRSQDLYDCERVGRTGVSDEDGHFTFGGPPALGPGTFYVVEWRNETHEDFFADDRMLGLWRSEPIVEYAGSEEIVLPDIELGDTTLTGPSKGTGFGGFPIRFTWDTRSPEPGVYHWAISEPACPGSAQLYDRGDNWTSPSVGRSGEYVRRSRPPNTQLGIEYRYCWFVEIRTEDAGWGWSHERWALWFQFLTARTFDLHGLLAGAGVVR